MYTNKFYAHEIAAVNLSKIYFLKNTKKTCKPNNRGLNRNWTTEIMIDKVIETMTFIKTFNEKKPFIGRIKTNLLRTGDGNDRLSIEN